MTTFEYAVCATRGDRSYQEDAAVFWPGAATFKANTALPPPSQGVMMAILADGMGGHAGGAIASQLACETFLKGVSGRIDLKPYKNVSPETTVPLNIEPIDPGETTTTQSNVQSPRTNDLLASLLAANAEIAQQTAGNPALAGMGTTFVAAAFNSAGSNASLEWVSVGDSPLYLCRGGEIALLNEDHSLAPALDLLAAEGTITAEAARNDPRRHMLRSAVTGEELDMIDLSRKPLVLQAGDVIVLASDGIHTLSEAEVARIVTAYGEDGCEAMANALVRSIENLRVPHQDNATRMVIRQQA
jgi:serine/threonine protein phosphatase PrpC